MKRVYFSCLVAAGAVAVLFLSETTSAQDKADKKADIVQIDLNKLPPEVAKRLLDELAKAAASAPPSVPAEREGRVREAKAGDAEKKAKGGEKPSKGKRPDRAKIGERPAGDKKPEGPAKPGEQPSRDKKPAPGKGRDPEKDK